MEPCILCASDPDRSSVLAVTVIDGIPYCKEHMPASYSLGHEELNARNQTPPCTCPEHVKMERRTQTTPHLPGCPGYYGQKTINATALDQTVDAKEAVNHPDHYGGADNPYEVIKVLQAWGLDKDAHLWNSVKYIARAGKKDPTKTVEDLRKARFYLDYAIKLLEDTAR